MSPTLPCRLVGQTGTALGAAASQDLTAIGGSHSLAEAVNLGSLTLLGLIGTNSGHFLTPPEKLCSTAANAAAATLVEYPEEHTQHIILDTHGFCQFFFILSEKTSRKRSTLYFAPVGAKLWRHLAEYLL